MSTPSDSGPLTDSVSLGHASEAFIDGKGQYHHDVDNQVYAEQLAQGLLKVPDRGPQEHISKVKGYCAHLVLGGCDKD